MRNKLFVIICILFYTINCFSIELSLSELTLGTGKRLDYQNNSLSNNKWGINTIPKDKTEKYKSFKAEDYSLKYSHWYDKANTRYHIYQLSCIDLINDNQYLNHNFLTFQIQHLFKERYAGSFTDFPIAFKIAASGVNSFSFNRNDSFNSKKALILHPIKFENQLISLIKNKNSVLTKSSCYIYEIEEKKFEARKNNIESKEFNNSYYFLNKGIDKSLPYVPIGKFKLLFDNKKINDFELSNNSFNALRINNLYSNMDFNNFVRGTGVKDLLSTDKKDLWRTIMIGGIIFSGVGCKFWSEIEYDKYLAATEQTSIDKYYERANFLNKSFYVVTITGAVAWLYNMIWIPIKNKRDDRKYKQNISFYHEPTHQTLGLNYELNF